MANDRYAEGPERVRVLVEVAAPQQAPTDEIFDSAKGWKSVGFDLDRS